MKLTQNQHRQATLLLNLKIKRHYIVGFDMKKNDLLCVVITSVLSVGFHYSVFCVNYLLNISIVNII